jgi:uncharacterized protein (DUF2336 family)
MMDAAEEVRVRQGASARTEPEVLARLAQDPSATVRATLALNAATPPEIDAALAKDPDERVRLLLARKLGAVVPDLSDAAHARIRQQIFDTLTVLAADQAMRVRAVLAEEIKSLPTVPHELVLRLAQDRAIMVCEPVILFSPLLTAGDLVALVADAPSSETVSVVARRHGINEVVSDAIAATADSAAIRAMLCNRTAQIREATLDALIDQATEHLDWHEPLVRRPVLPPSAARALSEIVAHHLVEVLAARTDLDPGVARDLQTRLTSRLADPPPEAASQRAAGTAALSWAQALHQAHLLTEEVLLDAIRGGDLAVIGALLATKAGVPVALVERAATLRSAKGIVSLAWKAGFGMNIAAALQVLLARLPPDSVLRAGPGGSFPLTIEEMRWQLDWLAEPPRH